MQMLIDIDEDYVKIINKNGASNYAEEVIKNGTPLPKGHDRLVEERAVVKALFSHKTIDDVPTIIESDKESEEICQS